ncbi:MAG: Rrf2 family transcriptional regulator [Deltaproteobacteria bacterium]|nr:Rrf2 family transcriptional regulator [Deltaproteobacteria bacterium]
MLSKSVELALAAVTRLAEVYPEKISLTATQIATQRQLARPFVAKLLTELSRCGLVVSKPGPNGGFSLGRDPSMITLLEIANCAGYRPTLKCCPFGPDYGEGQHCPMHKQVKNLAGQMDSFLRDNTLAGFSQRGSLPK